MIIPGYHETDEAFAPGRETMPVFFIGHGNPMNAIQDTPFSRAWTEEALKVERPAAILSISAHWQTPGSRVTAMQTPGTIHDFRGFPQELFDISYPAPGSPSLAGLICGRLAHMQVKPDHGWGLDHGTWSVLIRMFPDAAIPVVQLSLDLEKSPSRHLELGKSLQWLRQRGVLIVCSGNCIHNLQTLVWEDRAFDWALDVDRTLGEAILTNDIRRLVEYPSLHPAMGLAVPTDEHYLPMLYALGLREADEPVRFFCETVTLGSISMRSFRIG
jgi:4,5-DOPA dioxygenase extradiol